MKIKIVISAVLFYFLSIVFCTCIYPWDNEKTHQDLSSIAADHSVLSKGGANYLVKVGIDNGLGEAFPWNGLTKTLKQWLKDGAKQEDDSQRPLNHFHNPLQPWSSAGLHVSGLIPFGESAILWSQDSSAQANWSNGSGVELPYPGIVNIPDNTTPTDWSWQKTRDYFYLATSATSTTDREANFAKTFFGLGHQIHLLQDMSVPMHVRNNQHLIMRMIEGLVVKKESSIMSYITSTATQIPMPAVSLDATINGRAPVARLFDNDSYTGAAPISMTSTTVGLAEWTNANFFSDDTINLPGFTQNSEFPYPNAGSTDIQTYISQGKLPETYPAEDGMRDTSFWIKKTSSEGDTEIEHFAKPGYFTAPANSAIYNLTFNLDDYCYEDYAKLLLPRAVGYSAGLLNYFFRGSIDITLPSSGMYASAAAADSGFTTVKVLAKNTTSTGEDMPDGSIELVVKYKQALEDPFKNYPEDHFLQVSGFSYIVAAEKNGIRTISRTDPVELTFDLPAPIPFSAVDVYLQIVYHGKLGNEDGAVAVGFKDIFEPTPIDISSDTDRICMNGTFYGAGSQAAIDLVDTNHNGIAEEWDVYQHSQKDLYVKISSQANPQNASPTDYTFYIPALAAAGFSRNFYVLTDEHFSYSIVETWVNDNLSEDPWVILPSQARLYTGTAIKNQTDYVEDAALCSPLTAPCNIWWYPEFLSYRNREEWGGSGVMYINNAYPEGSLCSCYQGILNTCNP